MAIERRDADSSSPNVELDPARHQSEREGEAPSRSDAKERALALLAIREHSRYQLSAKLRLRGYATADAERALGELESEGLLSDRRFADCWIDARLRRNPEGRVLLYAGLIRQGVSRECADDALRSLDDDRIAEGLCIAAERMRRRSGTNRERLIAALSRKGFPLQAIRDYLGTQSD